MNCANIEMVTLSCLHEHIQTSTDSTAYYLGSSRHTSFDSILYLLKYFCQLFYFASCIYRHNYQLLDKLFDFHFDLKVLIVQLGSLLTVSLTGLR